MAKTLELAKLKNTEQTNIEGSMTPEAKLILFKKKVIKTWLQKGKIIKGLWPTPAEGERERNFEKRKELPLKAKKVRRKH